MSNSIDRMPSRWDGNLDGSFQTPILSIQGKAIGGMISSVAQSYSVLVGLKKGSPLVPLQIEGVDASIAAPADKAVILPPETFAFHFLRLVGTGAATVQIGTKS